MNSPLHSVLRDSLHSSLTPNRLPNRQIPTFTGTQYGTLDTPIVFTGDFEVESPAATTTNDASYRALFGGASTGAWVGSAATIGTIWFVVDGFNSGNVVPTTVTPFDGKVHSWRLTRVGTTVSLYIDGILQASGTGGGASVTFNEIGSTQSGLYLWIGQTLSTKFTDKSGAEDVVSNYVFDSGSTVEQFARGSDTLKVTLTNFTAANWSRYTLHRNIVHDLGVIAEGWLGDNVVVNGRFDADTASWSVTASNGTIASVLGELELTSGSTGMLVSSPLTLNSIGSHLIQLNGRQGTFTDDVQAGLSAGNTGPPADILITSDIDAKYTVISVAALTTMFFIFRFPTVDDGKTAYADNVSVQHLLEVTQ